MSNTNTEVLTTAYEKLQGAITQSNTVLPKLEEAVKNADLSNYATVSDLEEKANKSDVGSPLTASTVAEMTDTSKVYVNTTDGNWYSYNGTTWVIGGIYNSHGVGDGTITPQKTNFFFNSAKSKNLFNLEKAVIGKWINGTTGVLTDINDNRLTTGYIEVEEGKELKGSYEGSDGNRTTDYVFNNIAVYDENKNLIASEGSNSVTSYYRNNTSSGKKLVRFTVKESYQIKLQIEQIEIGQLPTEYEEYKATYLLKESMYKVPSKISELENDSNFILDASGVVVCAGDSLTRGANVTADSYRYPSVLQTLLPNNTVINLGVGGEDTSTIGGRQGGLMYIAAPFTIPAETIATEITLSSVDGSNVAPAKQGGNGLNPVKINGITGNITYNKTDYKLYFTRNTAGTTSIITRPTPVLTKGMDYKGGILVLWTGTNDIASTSNIDTIIKKQRNMIDYNNTSKYIVIGLTSKYQMPQVAEVNKVLAKEYGNHFLDIRKYILNYGLEDANITATEQDTTDIANGEMPTSLRSDNIHFNDTGYGIIAQQVYKKGQELGYW